MKDMLISNLLFKHHKQIQSRRKSIRGESRRKSIRAFLRSLIVKVNSHITGLEFHITAKHKTCHVRFELFGFVLFFLLPFCFVSCVLQMKMYIKHRKEIHLMSY